MFVTTVRKQPTRIRRIPSHPVAIIVEMFVNVRGILTVIRMLMDRMPFCSRKILEGVHWGIPVNLGIPAMATSTVIRTWTEATFLYLKKTSEGVPY